MYILVMNFELSSSLEVSLNGLGLVSTDNKINPLQYRLQLFLKFFITVLKLNSKNCLLTIGASVTVAIFTPFPGHAIF